MERGCFPCRRNGPGVLEDLQGRAQARVPLVAPGPAHTVRMVPAFPRPLSLSPHLFLSFALPEAIGEVQLGKKRIRTVGIPGAQRAAGETGRGVLRSHYNRPIVSASEEADCSSGDVSVI